WPRSCAVRRRSSASPAPTTARARSPIARAARRASRTRCCGRSPASPRGRPRIANRLLRRVRDFAQVKADGHITSKVATAALEMLKVDAEGFDALDRRLLELIIDHFDGG